MLEPTVIAGTVDVAKELAVCLRTRREGLDPRDFGLPARRPRRTPGPARVAAAAVVAAGGRLGLTR